MPLVPTAEYSIPELAQAAKLYELRGDRATLAASQRASDLELARNAELLASAHVRRAYVLNPTHNTSLEGAMNILSGGLFRKSAPQPGIRSAFVSLRLGVGAMYYGGVTFEIDARRLLDIERPRDVELIDKSTASPLRRAISDYRDPRVEMVDVSVALRRLSADAWTEYQCHSDAGRFAEALVSFDNYPELRVAGDLEIELVTNVYVWNAYEVAFEAFLKALRADPVKGPKISRMVVEYVDLGASPEDVFAAMAEHFKGADAGATATPIATLRAIAQRAAPAKDLARAEFKELRKEMVGAAQQRGLYLQGEKDTSDYHVLSAGAHARLVEAYMASAMAHVHAIHWEFLPPPTAPIASATTTGDGVTTAPSPTGPVDGAKKAAFHYDLGYGSAVHFPRHRRARDHLLIQMWGAGANTQDPSELWDAFYQTYPFTMHGLSCLSIAAARSTDYEAAVNALWDDVIQPYSKVYVMGFCASSMAAARMANHTRFGPKIAKLILVAPTSTFRTAADLKLTRHTQAQNLLLVSWAKPVTRPDEARHDEQGFDHLRALHKAASYARVPDAPSPTRPLPRGARQQAYVGQEYLRPDGLFVRDLWTFVLGHAIRRTQCDGATDRIAADRKSETVRIWQGAAAPPLNARESALAAHVARIRRAGAGPAKH